jgi:hypothetical protein
MVIGWPNAPDPFAVAVPNDCACERVGKRLQNVEALALLWPRGPLRRLTLAAG